MYLLIAMTIQTILALPLWINFLVSSNAGLVNLTGGKITEKVAESFHPSTFHLAAHDVVCQICIYMFLFLIAATGTKLQKMMMLAIYSIWNINQAVVQFTHPLTGEQPGIYDMPMPLLIIFSVVAYTGFSMEISPAKPKKL